MNEAHKQMLDDIIIHAVKSSMDRMHGIIDAALDDNHDKMMATYATSLIMHQNILHTMLAHGGMPMGIAQDGIDMLVRTAREAMEERSDA